MTRSSISSSSLQSFKNEKDYKNKLCGILNGMGAHVQCHEDRHTLYVPDVSFALHGEDWWMEVKYCQTEPRALESIPHYTIGQQRWLEKRGAAGGGYVGLLVGTPYWNAFWVYSTLAKVRKMPIKRALGYSVLGHGQDHELREALAYVV